MFGKGSEEWKMFADFYKLCEKFWTPPSTEDKAWWDEMWSATIEFKNKYCDDKSKFAEELIMALHDRLKSLTSNQMKMEV